MPAVETVSPTGTRPRACLSLLAVVALLLGLAMAGMGVWPVFLGGSFYDMLAGAAITVAAAAILVGRAGAGVGLFALVVTGTLIWSFAEIHADGWMPAWGFDLAGRVGLLVGLLVLMVLSLAFLRPRRTLAAGRSQLVSLGVALLLVGAAAASTSLLVDGDSLVVFALPPHTN